MFHTWFLLVPIALTIGWAVAYVRYKHLGTRRLNQLSKEYFVGLNYLLNEEQDKAVDIFIKLLEVDGDTVETHLALGNLFRRRGEVDRAIRVHQNIIARPCLDKHQRVEALLALGHDYFKAGVLDRAERLFLEVGETAPQSITALNYLLKIYAQEKNWQHAIAVAKKLETISGQDMSVIIAHYHCELAQEEKSKGQVETALRYLRQAKICDRDCVRASIMQGDIERALGRYKSAIRSYKRVAEQNPDHIVDIAKDLLFCFEQLEREQEGLEYLCERMEKHASTPLMMVVSEHIQRLKDKQSAADYVAVQLRRKASIQGLDRLIELHLGLAGEKSREDLIMLKTLTTNLIENKPLYRCADCGFSGKTLQWQCPSCKNWSKFSRIDDVTLVA